MSLLNKNSYSVYIIHVIVLGLIALALLNIPIPAFAKYLILAILTFVASNILVYAYDRLFENNTYLKVGTLTLLVIGLFTFIYFGNKAESAFEKEQSMISQTEQALPVKGLHEAVVQGDLEAIRQHIKAGSDLDVKEPSGGSSPLITAAVFGKTDIALALIEAGADVNFKNNEGSTPLHSAAFFCRTAIVEALLSNGADQTIKNDAGSTALDSVIAPFEAVKGIYDYFVKTLGPLGLKLDYERIKRTRPKIAEMLR